MEMQAPAACEHRYIVPGDVFEGDVFKGGKAHAKCNDCGARVDGWIFVCGAPAKIFTR
jgi:hypothetical protein